MKQNLEAKNKKRDRNEYKILPGKYLFKFHIIFTMHSVLCNSFYFNQHMHYNFVVLYTPTYVSTTQHNNTLHVCHANINLPKKVNFNIIW
jgi:hypothetical protein